MKSRTFGCVAIAALLSSLAAAQGRTVGSFTIARNVTYSLSGSDNFIVANPHDGIRDGSLVRTGKRAFGEIVFNDSSVMRVNERTDLVVHDSPSMRNIALNNGVVWVKVKTGTHTAVQTPVGTATARGTTFLVGSTGYLHVIDGTVELKDKDNKEILLVTAGETALIGATGLPQMATGGDGSDSDSGSSSGTGGTSDTAPSGPGGTGGIGATGTPSLTDPGSGVDNVGLPGKEGFPHGWYMSEGEMFGSYSDSGGTSDQFFAPVAFWHPWIGLLALGTGILFHSGGTGPSSGGHQSAPEPATLLVLGAGAAGLVRSRRKAKQS